MKVAIWMHVVVAFLLAGLVASLFSLPVIFRLIYPLVVPSLEGLGISSPIAMFAGLVLSIFVVVIGALPANLYFMRASVPCAKVGCAGKAMLIHKRTLTYKCSVCGSLQKTWFGLGR